MASMNAAGQHAALEKAFASKDYKLGDAGIVARAQQLAAQLHISPEAFANHYDSYALISDWSMEVTAQRLKAVADYLEAEQRKENARPRAAGAAVGAGSGLKGLPQASKPTWEDLPDKMDFPTPSAKRQALDPAALNPGTGSNRSGLAASAAPGSAQQQQQQQQARGGGGGGGGTPQPIGLGQRGWAGTPVAATGGKAGGAAGTPAPPSAFSQRTNRGQTMAVLNEHLPGPSNAAAAAAQRGSGGGGVAVRPLGQAALDGVEHMFMMEVLESKVQALDERIMDFADALTAVTRITSAAAAAAAPAPSPAVTAPTGTPGPVPTPNHAAAPPAAAGTPPPATTSAAAHPALTPNTVHTPGATAGPAAPAAAAGVAQPLLTSVSEMSHQPVWVAGRVLAEAEGAPLNAESLLLEGCREASGGARVRLDVSCLPGYRLFPGQTVCAYGLNPTGSRFIAQRLVTHLPPPPALLLPAAVAGEAPSAGVSGGGSGGGMTAEARAGGLSLVVAAGPYCLTEDLSYSPLEELLSYCSASPPDVLLLLGPFVDCEHPRMASGSADRTAEEVLREEVLRRLAAWRAALPAGVSPTLALMPAVRDVTALPVMPQPPMTAAAAAVGPADQVVALQNPATASMGPVVLAAASSDLLKALSGAELARVPAGATVERLPALASHVLGQRSFYPLYPAPPGTCLDTSHYSQLGLPTAPDLLLLPSDLAPFAKVLRPEAWASGAPPGLLSGGGAGGAGGCAAASAAPVVVVNPGRLSRGGGGGSFAHVVVAPGAGPMHERTRVEVKRV